MERTTLTQEAADLRENLLQSYQYDEDRIEDLIKKHPDPEVWMDHFRNDLISFWYKPNDPNGPHIMTNNMFRSFFTHDGKPLSLNQDEWPQEYRDALNNPDPNGPSGLVADYDKNFVRAHSRQTFAYGIAYHVTGNSEYFELCKQGAEALLSLADKDGAMYTQQNAKDGTMVENRDERTSQDLAYGMTGICFYYYLTHDAHVLKKLLLIKDYIFNNYFAPGKDLFTWLPKYIETDSNVELVAQLDQIYGYMLFTMPSLPQPYKDQWKEDLKHIACIMVKRFYSEAHGIFWGRSTDSFMHALGGAHTDFGHSVKAMWLLYQIGVWNDDLHLISFTRTKIAAILKNAYDEEGKAWTRRYDADGKLDKSKEWWSFAELDQASAILSLNDPVFLRYINNTYQYWLNTMVDKENGEIWHMVGPDGVPDKQYPKAHCWKTNLHSFEHALFAYITSAQIKNRSFTLYYTFESEREAIYQKVSPYLFKGNIASVSDCGQDINMMFGVRGKKFAVSFDNLH